MGEPNRRPDPSQPSANAVERAARAPSLVALAAAFEGLDAAAIQVRGVCEWVERLAADRQLAGDEASRLWAFAETTRDFAGRIRADADRLAELLRRQFVSVDGAWTLSEREDQELHEVLAALAASDAERHAKQMADAPRGPADAGPA
jgi:hypothetical protein